LNASGLQGGSQVTILDETTSPPRSSFSQTPEGIWTRCRSVFRATLATYPRSQPAARHHKTSRSRRRRSPRRA